MRASLGIVIVAMLCGSASANRIAVLVDPASGAALGSAMRVALGGQGTLTIAEPPPGELRLDRAAAAQHAAVALGADAALWIDGDAVCVVSADGTRFRHAPLPAGASPRVIAAIATSLLDELAAPPEPPSIGVDVHVSVGGVPQQPQPPPAPAPAYVQPASPPPTYYVAPPSLATTAPLAAPPAPRRSQLEIGALASPLAIGVEADLTFPIASSLRVGLVTMASAMFESGTWDQPFNLNPHYGATGVVYGIAGEVRYERRTSTRGYELGVLFGALGSNVQLDAEDAPVFVAALRLGIEIAPHTMLSVSPGILFSVADNQTWSAPIAWATLRWQLPL